MSTDLRSALLYQLYEDHQNGRRGDTTAEDFAVSQGSTREDGALAAEQLELRGMAKAPFIDRDSTVLLITDLGILEARLRN